MLELNEKNYFSKEMNLKYTGSSQIKVFFRARIEHLQN